MKHASLLLACVLAAIAAPAYANADDSEFDTWAMEYEAVVEQGAELFADPFFSENGKSCAECHPGASNTHPGSYPKYRKNQQRVVQLWEMINWCIEKALGKDALDPRAPELTALVAYIRDANKGDAPQPKTP